MTLLQDNKETIDNAKVMACFNLSRSRMFKDQKTIDNLFKATGESESKKMEVQNTILTVALLNCYENISIEQIQEIFKQKPEELDYSKPVYKRLLNIENWREFYKGKSIEKIQQDVKSLNEKVQKIMNQHLNVTGIPQKENPKSNNENRVNRNIDFFSNFEFMESWDDTFQFTLVIGIFLSVFYTIIFITRKILGK